MEKFRVKYILSVAILLLFVQIVVASALHEHTSRQSYTSYAQLQDTTKSRVTTEELKKNKVTVFAAHLKGDEYYAKNLYEGSVAFLIGNEGNGLSDEIAKMADKYVKIPMDGMVESLNASVAAAILMYEAKRQKAE